MNTQTQEYEKLKQEGISKILENGNGSWYDLVNDGFDLAEKLRQATQPIAAEGKSAGVWVRASERMPELYPVNNSHEFHYRLDSYKVDGFFLHSQCFEYFNPEIAGYTQLELTEFNRIEWLDEYASQPKGAGVPKEFIICAANWYNDKKKHERQPKNIIEGFTVCGRRHHNCIGTFAQIVGFPYTQAGHEIHETEIQGFLTNTNRFVSRKEAFEIARDANQIQGPNKGQQENSIGLTSEDLY